MVPSRMTLDPMRFGSYSENSNYMDNFFSFGSAYVKELHVYG